MKYFQVAFPIGKRLPENIKAILPFGITANTAYFSGSPIPAKAT
ncbi:hypothetical protein [Eikenella glucosivorans]|nr:hypothetical protein [Eikenella glucosivorans]